MPNLKEKVVPKLFLDSSVIIAAALSPTGGAFRILQEAQQNKLKLYISSFVFTEVTTALQKKYPDNLSVFKALFSETPIKFVKDPSSNSVNKAMNSIHSVDAPILAAAIKAKPDFLVTWNTKHFLKNKVIQNVPFIVCTPKEFLQKHWHRS